MAVFGAVGSPGFLLCNSLEVDVDGVVTAGTRVDAKHFLGLANLNLDDGYLAAVRKGNRQCLIHHLRIVPDAEFVAHIVDVVPITFLQLQHAATMQTPCPWKIYKGWNTRAMLLPY